MTRDIVNFNAGPAGLPAPALAEAQKELLDFEGSGISIIEHSHRGAAFARVHAEAQQRFRRLYAVPDSHAILFLQGGASGAFATVPMNFLGAGQRAEYVITGAWSKKALAEAERLGSAAAVASGMVDGAFVRVPAPGEIQSASDAAYLHITTNNTIAGTQFHDYPTPDAPLVADMSSDIMSRPIDIARFKMIYAGAQKNLGPSGLLVAVIDRAWAASAREDIPKIFRYQTHIEADSLYHTPPTFAVYLLRNVLRWAEDVGGLSEIAARNQTKAAALYDAIDASDGFYRNPVAREARSLMNVVFRLPSEADEARFVAQAEEAGLIGLKGHRSVGGIRASIYNAMSVEGVERLVDFMQRFQKAS